MLTYEMDILAKNLLILASAGSGKTFQLGNRIIGLIAMGAEPERIVALTFTRKAAGEFADSLLTKLANAAMNENTARALQDEIGIPDTDFQDVLQNVTQSLHRLTLGTMDSFFSKVVRGFQYDLGLSGGRFELIEGPRAEALQDEILTGILSDVLTSDDGQEFIHAFRRATTGKEQQSILSILREFIQRWHQWYREAPDRIWGPEEHATVKVAAWEQQKHALAKRVLRGIESIDVTRKGQREAFEATIETLRSHNIGSGSLGSPSSLLKSMLTAVAETTSGPLVLKFYKEFTIDGPSADALREMILLAAHCEYAAALQRTRAVRKVVEAFDRQCEKQLRSKGSLGFNDVKLLMGQWAHSEDARLRREAVDFRLDARIDHWLLDEFQDTSRADWNGLLPLVDEAAAEASDGSLFIVGDRKQAIYAWRGGDVSLFDEVQSRYAGGLKSESLTESWRSCPEVLKLVNQICGDIPTLHELFGEVAECWDWQDHRSAEPLMHEGKRGQARIEIVGDWDARLERMAEILKCLDVNQRKMSCGILLRGNQKAREVADYLRTHQFDVILEGHREPGVDTPIGVATTQLLKWLANPTDRMARGTVEMSPLIVPLRAQHGNTWPEIWNSLSHAISQHGYYLSIRDLVADQAAAASEFGRSRTNDILAALTTFDQQDGITTSQAGTLLERLQISQSPGTAAVQVMTIHKSKGLGFDVVILPEISNDSIPQAQRFDIAGQTDWLSETPAQWARTLIPELKAEETAWGMHQRYEAFCTLYVALTRSKRGLYVLLDPPAKSSEESKASLANWAIQSCDEIQSEPHSLEFGSNDWSHFIPLKEALLSHPSTATLHPITANHKFSAAKPPSHMHAAQSHSPSGMKFGSAVHELLENITWIDEMSAALPTNAAGELVARILSNPSTQAIFQRQGRSIQLFREQAMDVIVGGTLISGIIDRLHVHTAADGSTDLVEIIDFKTDATADLTAMSARHSAQLERYRECLQRIYPTARVTCQILSTHHQAAILI